MSVECETRGVMVFAPAAAGGLFARLAAWAGWAPIARATRLAALSCVVPGALLGAAAFLSDPARGDLARWLDARIAGMSPRPGAQQLAPLEDTAGLSGIFERRSFRLEDVREGWAPVPRIFLTGLPGDISGIVADEARKTLFMQAALPLVLLVNESILGERERIQLLRDKTRDGGVLTPGEQHWLRSIARRYRAKSDDFEDLLRRVDIIPPSLALAQGAVESGWGTSRPAREDNALFGQMTWTAGATRADGAQEEPAYIVQPFDDLLECVRAYARNLNSHPAYAEFRERRAEMRALGQRPDGYRLAITLDAYSERGWPYLAEVRLTIRANRLTELDRAWLDGPSSALLLVPRT